MKILNTGKKARNGNKAGNSRCVMESVGNEVDNEVLSQESLDSREMEESRVNEDGSSERKECSDAKAPNDTVSVNKNDNNKPVNNEPVVEIDEFRVDKNLIYIAPKIREDGIETVLFDEEIIPCKKDVGEIWLKEVIGNVSGINLFKFNDSEGMQYVLDQGPWMVNNRPLFVMKWDPEIGMQKVEPRKLPVWVKLMQLPIEAWSMEGISAIASSLGKPLMMDDMTARMCKHGVGSTEFARVLVEFEAKKGLKDAIKIEYTDKEDHVKGTKEVKVKYDWRPEVCTFCSVFGHCYEKCKSRPRTQEENKDKLEKEEIIRKANLEREKKAFDERQNQRRNWQQQRRNEQVKDHSTRQEYREKSTVYGNMKKTNGEVPSQNQKSGSNVNVTSAESIGVSTSRNKFDALNSMVEDEEAELRVLKDRMLYFKDHWEIDRLKEQEDQGMNNEDVFENRNGIAQTMDSDDVIGLKSYFVYASNSRKERKVAWKELLLAKRSTNGWPWLVMGDFNVTIKTMEHSAGGSAITSHMQDLIDCVNEVEVEDLCSTGLFYTWIKSPLNPTNNILKKLDRAMVNEEFMGSFPVYGVLFPFNNRPLCIRAAVLPHPSYHLQSLFLTPPLMMLLFLHYMVSDLSTVLVKLPQAKVDWISKGDRNNKYFHKLLKSRRQASKILSICDEDGKRYEGKQMEDQFVNHFKQFLGARNNHNNTWNNNGVLGNKLSALEAEDMVRDITDKEVKMAMFDIGDNKAPGPDGYTSTFYKKAWSLVGNDVCLAVKEFFRTRKLLGEVNATLLSLIPKINSPNKVYDFRPISCCNVIYKCISLSERLKPSLKKLVNLNQSAFIQGRVIQDNIFITQELLKGYDRKSGPKRCCLKIDIAKAYDNVDWNFLEQTLIQFGFHQKMVKWIMVCVSTANSQFVLMGKEKAILQVNVQLNGNYKYHAGCKEMKLTHLCFADDLLVMCNGDVESVRTVKETLLEFSNISGLLPNMSKSTVFFGNVKAEVVSEILKILPFKIGKLPVKYLGVPLITKKIGNKECKQLVDKVRNKVEDWKNKYLSYAGRLQLIASVLSSLNVYWAAVFLIPKTVVKDIDKVLKGFLWCKGGLKRGKAKVAWKTVCSPKSQGGLGLRALSTWNEALLIKNLWNIAAGKETLWVKWVNSVKLKGKSIWQVQKEYNDSWMWKTLLDLRSKVRNNIWKVIGNGRKINMWQDLWCNKGILSDIVTTRSIHNARLPDHMTVSEMIVNDKWCWPEDWVDKYLVLTEIEVPKLELHKEDSTMWKATNGKLGEFSSKAAWNLLSQQNDVVNWKDVVWFSQCNLRMAFILWMAVKGRLQTQDRIMIWNNDTNMKCTFCKTVNDSHRHLFFECDYSRGIWEDLKVKLEVGWMTNSWEKLIEQYAQGPSNNSISSVLRRIGLATAVYYIWKERNNRLFTGEAMDNMSLKKIIIESIKLQLLSLKVKKSAQVIRIAQR
ncbi:RNA-directed DNA polymerase, eukaryota, reverse transcriptase zinc-binding domain protein [Tanacetum coccineum]